MTISPVWINRGGSLLTKANIKKAEKHYKAKYIGDFSLKLNNGDWGDNSVALFWCENPSQPSYSNYLALFHKYNYGYDENDLKQYLTITDGISATEGYWNGIVADDGEIIYSRSGHDFRTSIDETVSIDGGKKYTRYLGHIGNPRVRISIVRDQLVVNDCLYFPYEPPQAAYAKRQQEIADKNKDKI
jgi:hypothetical protein